MEIGPGGKDHDHDHGNNKRFIDALAPNGTLFARSGVIRVQYLPPIDPSEWSRENLAENMELVREEFLNYCPDGTA